MLRLWHGCVFVGESLPLRSVVELTDPKTKRTYNVEVRSLAQCTLSLLKRPLHCRVLRTLWALFMPAMLPTRSRLGGA